VHGGAFFARIETGATQTLKGSVVKLDTFGEKSFYEFKFLRTVVGPELEHVLAYRFVDGFAPSVGFVTQANKLNAPSFTYWVTTVVFAGTMAWSAVLYVTSSHEQQIIAHLHLPSYFRVDLAFCKAAGGWP
jgi:hypothetical protein